mgnify:FL=1
MGFKKECGRRWRMILTAALLLFGCAGSLAGCSASGTGNAEAGSSQDAAGNGSSQNAAAGDGRLQVAATIFPYYDFLRQIGGDRIGLQLVVPAGMDSHSFEPTPADMIAMQEADILVCNGGAMEQWVSQVLSSLDTGGMEVLTMMDYVDVVEEELVEGMEDADHGHDHSHEEDEAYDHSREGDPDVGGQAVFDPEDGHALEIAYDEHIWTSPVNAITIVEILCDALSQADPENREYFEANAAAYTQELADLDARFRRIVENGKRRMFVVADKFPLRYFADTYGLSYRAAFSGCSTDTEPSAKTIAYLIDQVREQEIPAVYYLELSSHRTAEIIGEETGAASLLFHSCHNVTRREFDGGVSYLQLMNQNAVNLEIGLN